MKKRIIVITDSVGLPRPSINLPYDKTYVGLMEKTLDNVNLWTFSYGGRTVTEFLVYVKEVLELLKDKEFFDYAVVAIGLVDCSVRLLPRPLRSCVNDFPKWLKKPVINALQAVKPRFVKALTTQYTPRSRFSFEFNALIEMLSTVCRNILVVPVINVPPAFLERSPRTDKQIKLYNSEIKSVVNKYYSCCTYIDLDTDLILRHFPSWILPDGHITEGMHNYIFNTIKNQIGEINKERSIGNDKRFC